MIKAALSLPPFIECGSLAGEERFPDIAAHIGTAVHMRLQELREQYELTVHQKSKSVWIARGDVDGEPLEVMATAHPLPREAGGSRLGTRATNAAPRPPKARPPPGLPTSDSATRTDVSAFTTRRDATRPAGGPVTYVVQHRRPKPWHLLLAAAHRKQRIGEDHVWYRHERDGRSDRFG
jgi:hypothetical protein